MTDSDELNKQVMDRLEDLFRDVKISNMETHIREQHPNIRRTPEREIHDGSCPQSRKNSVDVRRTSQDVRRTSQDVRRASQDVRRASQDVRHGPHEIRRASLNTGRISTAAIHNSSAAARKGSFGARRDSTPVSLREPGSSRRDSAVRRCSLDSLESGRRDSLASVGSGGSGGSGHLADLIEENEEEPEPLSPAQPARSSSVERPRFVPVTSLEDVQAVRCAEFHPFGKLYAVGSNSKTLRICAYPKLVDLRDDQVTYQPTVLLKRTKHHKGSIYCMAWSPVGDLIATGSNDKTIKLMRFDADSCSVEDPALELTMHNGTVRDVCFIEDMSNKSSLLVSGGAGDCQIYVTDCATGTPFQALSGHTGPVLGLSTWGGAMFVSGSQDRTVRVWDLRSRGCVSRLQPPSVHAASRGSAVAAVAVDPSGRMLVSGHEDSSCGLFDLRGERTIQTFRPHDGAVRSVRFSPHAFYLLTGGHDNRLVLSDLQGDLTMPLPSVAVAQHQDKVITGRWHPYEFSFLSAGADKTCTLWALPPF
ncbi:WD repeat-containing protein 47-like [Pollicipes pollicipes]|uniref:WD repeat-containing protein 47-like n=1 Tax=Pollicipes pollicipes TaxID=41117 RepID=UPI00188548EB|nr:WD repeat-containing protein 47-like [Pollicipes pollicipes]